MHAPALAATIALTSALPVAAQSGDAPSRRLHFSGSVDADVSSDFGTLDRARHLTGLEADLSTHVIFSPTLYGVVRTTMRDGHVPRHGSGNTWSSLDFDGAQVNWKPGAKTVVMVGDLVAGTGYYQYARYKRTAAVIGEHSVRGAGFRYGNILVHAGMAVDTVGENGDWSVFAKWTRTMTEGMTWSPSFRYTGGIRGASPFELGISFDGSFDQILDVRAHAGMNYWNPDTDPGSVFLVEPRYVYDRYFFAGTFLYSDKGEVPSPNAARFTGTWNPVDDVILQIEPGMVLDRNFSAGLSFEFRNARMGAHRDESLWLIPTLYAIPAPGAEWWVWSGLEKPLAPGRAGHPRLALGSEIFFSF